MADLLTYMGLEIVVDSNIPTTERKEDWSKSRSASRAKRRLKRGFKQRLVVTYEPKNEIYRIGNRLVMHPVTYKEFLKKMDENGRFIEQGSRATNDLPFRDRPESKSSEYNFGRDYFRYDTGFSPYLSRIYN